MIDEGYIKFDSDWTPGEAPDAELTGSLNDWRRPLYDAGLIGHYADAGVGYGNLSTRTVTGERFVISGTQTGHLAETDGRHYALVTDYDIARNRVSSTGPVQASSESLTHAAIYELDESISAVVHVHSRLLWDQLINQAPTTAADVSYGTPEMAHELARLYRDDEFAKRGIAVMAGHDEGIVSIGQSLEEAATRILGIQSESR
jgi:ribulose-5-phosphate 4-epimerase/fuculose-1-phosphate aldolase